jgi:hypothetical protein
MTQSDQSDSPKVWPRTPDGYCSCPYCTAQRNGELPPVENYSETSPWLRRMGRPDSGRL